MDVYEPGPGSQLHDLNPSVFPPTGLFWTLAVPGDSIDINPGKGSASMEGSNIPIFDYGNIGNALFGGGPAGVPGHVSYKVKWSGVDSRANVSETDSAFGPHAGEYVRNMAQMEWTASVGDYTFVSAPLSTSSSLFAEIGHERNGLFYP